MNTGVPNERQLPAPETLGLETRTVFRREAVRLLDALPEGRGRLTIDLTPTREVDSSGLNALILIRRAAARRRLTVRLRGVSDELRVLLALTKLDRQFEMESET